MTDENVFLTDLCRRLFSCNVMMLRDPMERIWKLLKKNTVSGLSCSLFLLRRA